MHCPVGNEWWTTDPRVLCIDISDDPIRQACRLRTIALDMMMLYVVIVIRIPSVPGQRL